jgi:molybdopterin synthase sulfur carrier subunit
MQVRFFAGAAEAAGTDGLDLDASGLDADQVVARLVDGRPDLARVLTMCSLLADGVRVSDGAADMSRVELLDILPPFAGG